MSEDSGVVQSPTVVAHEFEDDGVIPNNELPFLAYRQVLVFSGRDSASVCERVFAGNGWGSTWRNGIYSFPHYHSTAHEVLGICAGTARVRFGGEGGVILDVEAGDVVVIPAGVGHENLGASSDLLVVGGYPTGEDWDLCRGETGERSGVLERIAQVPMPSTDPVYGAEGPLIVHWRGR